MYICIFITYRLPFRNVVVGLLANQLLLQTIGSVLLSTDSANSTTEKREHFKMTGTEYYYERLLFKSCILNLDDEITHIEYCRHIQFHG